MPAPARAAVTDALTAAAGHFPDIPADLLKLDALEPRDRALATAIYRTVMQRWLTVEYLLDRFASRPVAQMQPELRAVLMGGAGQLIFLKGLQAYAVINDAVDLAKSRVTAKAGGLVNAVLRKVSTLPVEWSLEPWRPDAARLPDPRGRSLYFEEPVLPALDNPVRHLAVATSHPRPLVRSWVETLGLDAAIKLCVAGLRTPPTVVWDETEESRVWKGGVDTLATWLAGDPRRWVQDPASVKPVLSTAALTPKRILDLCAGRGTKTRQLRAMHPDAGITAWDPDRARRQDLGKLDGIEVAEPHGRYDLILLDVPCSNTGVLARRPEARYRWDARRLDSLRALQRQIIDRALEHAEPGGVILYSTCSIDPEENAAQAAYLAERAEGKIEHEDTLLPDGIGRDYHDGSYHAVVRLAGR